ncbi:MAG: GNAT family N-acetyltransferase [Archangium sp.]|nr:GNAT family N-acetyltransferase [Archangium sp.]
MPTPTFRLATDKDVPAIIALLGDDEIARAREGFQAEVTPQTLEAFKEIEADKNNELWVGELDGKVIATLQLTLIPGLSRGGSKRALLEAMRVHADHRSQGVGEQLMNAMVERAKTLGCGLLQLTTDTRRLAAHRFYVRMGFEPSHVGMKRKV